MLAQPAIPLYCPRRVVAARCVLLLPARHVPARRTSQTIDVAHKRWTAQNLPAGSEKGQASVRVLVLEDDRDLNRQLVAALTDAGYAVDAAFDGEEGFFLGETEPDDVVILDTGLP